MHTDYCAFISYRHHEDDSRVAKIIQQLLEHYHVPLAIQKSTGIKRLFPVFLDKSELPITSDINDDILEALESAEYLIVICSPHTSEFVWVEREIQQFIKFHSQDRIITVLAEGEPKEIIPESLRWKTERLADKNGNIEEMRVPVEPLSCDFRGCLNDRRKKRIACRDELPRLAASLLNCSYDTIRQRQRQYQMRRLTAVFLFLLALAAGFGAYYFRSSLLIQENYDNALRNQSMYLANEALELKEKGDKHTAVQLALEALPSEEGDRPWIPHAEYALSQSLDTYAVPDNMVGNSIYSLQQEGSISEFVFNGDGSILYVMQVYGVMTAWDTATRQKLYSLYDVYDMELAVQDQILLTRQQVFGYNGYDAKTGEHLWSYDYVDYTYQGELWFSGDGKLLYLQAYPVTDADVFLSDPFGAKNIALQALNLQTGEVSDEIYTIDPEIYGNYFQITGFLTSNDDRYIAISYETEVEGGTERVNRVAVYDKESGATRTLPLAFDEHCDCNIALAAENRLIVFQGNEDEEAFFLHGYDLLQGEPLWSVECPWNGHGYDWIERNTQTWGRMLRPFAYPNENGSCEAVLCAFKQQWYVFRTSDGTQLNAWELPYGNERDTAITDEGIWGIGSDGSTLFASFDDGSLSQKKHFAEGYFTELAVHAANGELSFAVAKLVGTTAFFYGPKDGEQLWNAVMDGKSIFGWPGQIQETAHGILATSDLRNWYGDRNLYLYLFDPITKQLKWQYPAEDGIGDEVWQTTDGGILETKKQEWIHLQEVEDSYLRLHLEGIGISGDGNTYMAVLQDNIRRSFNSESSALVCIDLATGKTSVSELIGSFTPGYNILPYGEDQLIAFNSDYISTGIVEILVMDVEGNILRSMQFEASFEYDSYYSENVFEVSEDGACVLWQEDHDTSLYLIDTQTWACSKVEGIDEELAYIEWNADQSHFVATGAHSVTVCNRKGEAVLRLPLEGQSLISAYLAKNNVLMVVCNNRHLYLYRSSDGMLLGRVELPGAKTIESVRWIENENGRLICLVDDDAGEAHAYELDADTGAVCAQVDGCYAYLPKEDLFITQPNGRDSAIGYYPRQDLSELIERAKTFVGDRELNEEQRQQYGLIQ